ncbi:MAG: IPTL-CTERM sorting domain-containing protein [Casimicrobiaceae bacterium]
MILRRVSFTPLSCRFRGLGALAARSALALALVISAAGAIAQTVFDSSIRFDKRTPIYAAREDVNVDIFLYSDTDPVTNVSFTSTLPAGVKFKSAPARSQCGGTVTYTATTFMLTNGSFPIDNGCDIVVDVYAEPLVDTTYTFNTGTIHFTSGNTTSTSSDAKDFQVQAGMPPEFSGSIPGDGRVGESYYYPIVVSGTAPITVQALNLPPGLYYDPVYGEVDGRPTKPGSYDVTFKAQNGFPPNASETFTINILPAALSVGKTFMPQSIVTGGTAQLLITLTTTEPVSLINLNDPFPGGLAATTPGTSSQCGGTVTVQHMSVSYQGDRPGAGNCTIVVPVTSDSDVDRTIVNTTSSIAYDDGLQIDGVSGTLFVHAGVPPTITSGQPPSGVVGDIYHFVLFATGTPPISFSVSGLPPGLAFDPTTVSITGKPTAAGSYPGTIAAHNAFGPDDTQRFTIIIRNPPLAIITSTLPPINGGQPVNVPIVAQGGIPPYTFTLLSGQLPPGLAFDAQGNLVGVPTLPGVYTFTAQVVDSVGTKATRTYTITIQKTTPVFAFTVTPDPAVIGQTVNATATLTGAAGAAGGNVQVWLAHSGERCPVVAGDTPVAAKTVVSALNAGSAVNFAFADLGIDHYQVCAIYAGDVRYNPVNAGPYDLFVIKGALLSAPKVAIAAPGTVKANQVVNAQVTVNALTQGGNAPSGSVLLRADGVVVGTIALSGGVATFSTTAPGTPGQMTLTASYMGDGAFPPAISAPALVAVTKGDPAAVAPVPTLSAWALLLLSALIAALGIGVRSRRRSQ